MSYSHRIVTLAIGCLMLAALACEVQPPGPPSMATAVPTTAPNAPAAPEATTAVESTVPPTVVPNTPTQPTATLIPTATATITPTTAPVNTMPVATKTPAQGAKLDFTLDDIEYSLSGKRKSDNKAQLTITLHPKGGVAPFYFVLDPGAVETKINGLTYTFDWHNCNESEPHSIVLYSADGQKSKVISFIPPYNCQ
jgi:hypothetical protein